MALTHLLLLISISLIGAEGRIITFKNGCNVTIWPGFLETYAYGNTDPWQQLADDHELVNQDYQLKPGESINITTPDEEWQGMIWGRHGCSFDSFGNGTCVSGDCGGKLKCPKFTYFPFPPITSGFIFLNSSDSYWITLETGFNLPMSILPYGYDNSSPCQASSCLSDINRICPSDRQVIFGDEIVACVHDCITTDTPEYCCYEPNGICETSSYFIAVKNACPNAVHNLSDMQTNTFTCTRANYMVSFC